MTKTFLAHFVESYNDLGNTDIFGIQRVFIPITEIRSKVCTNMKITNKEFNKSLYFLADCEMVSLHGAPTDVYLKFKNPFEYEGKLYVYVSLR